MLAQGTELSSKQNTTLVYLLRRITITLSLSLMTFINFFLRPFCGRPCKVHSKPRRKHTEFSLSPPHDFWKLFFFEIISCLRKVIKIGQRIHIYASPTFPKYQFSPYSPSLSIYAYISFWYTYIWFFNFCEEVTEYPVSTSCVFSKYKESL